MSLASRAATLLDDPLLTLEPTLPERARPRSTWSTAVRPCSSSGARAACTGACSPCRCAGAISPGRLHAHVPSASTTSARGCRLPRKARLAGALPGRARRVLASCRGERQAKAGATAMNPSPPRLAAWWSSSTPARGRAALNACRSRRRFERAFVDRARRPDPGGARSARSSAKCWRPSSARSRTSSSAAAATDGERGRRGARRRATSPSACSLSAR